MGNIDPEYRTRRIKFKPLLMQKSLQFGRNFVYIFFLFHTFTHKIKPHIHPISKQNFSPPIFHDIGFDFFQRSFFLDQSM